MKLKFTAVTMRTAEDGTAELTLSIDPISRGAVKPVVAEAREIIGKHSTATFKLESPVKRRTLSQNALLWQLLTIYADELNGGRTGGESPESLYYKMLERYGVAVYVAIPEVCVDELRKSYRKIEIIDNLTIDRNGRKTPAKMVKCILGSSKYTTAQMKKLIDGIFDDLAALGVDAGEELTELYEDWQERNKNDVL